MIAFSIWLNGLEPLKPLVTKLQKRNTDIYQAYQMIYQVIGENQEQQTVFSNIAIMLQVTISDHIGEKV